MPENPRDLYAEDIIIVQKKLNDFISGVEAVEDQEFDSKYKFKNLINL